MRTLGATGLPGTFVPACHARCPHNEIAALLKRSLAPLPVQAFSPLGDDTLRCFKQLRMFVRKYVDGTWSHLQVAQSYNGRLRNRYLEAERSLRVDGPVEPRDWRIDAFLKVEKFNCENKFAKPRLIFPRSPRYNLDLATRLKPFEHWLWGRLTAQTFSTGGIGRVVAKGLNQRQRANLIKKKMENLDGCVVCEVDGQAFEAHVSKWQLMEEHKVYSAAFPGDKGLKRLLAAQLNLSGRLSCGAKFSREGGRASGDFNTGMGNSIIMLVVVVAVLRRHKVPFDLLVDGDNALVFLRGVDASLVLSTFAHDVLHQCGHEMTLEEPTTVLERVTFGRSSPVYTTGGWTMVRDWRRVVSQALSSHIYLREPNFRKEWVRGVVSAELSLALGVPVLQAYFSRLQSQWGGPEGVRAHPHADLLFKGAWFAKADQVKPITQEARLSFERAFGLAPDDQVRTEHAISSDLGDNWTYISVPRAEWQLLPPSVAEWWIDRPSDFVE
ncbi:RNA-dependent RNA polymerase [Setosphaeria turcica ambiguivirus 1]|nr:RNA-dependent RNA polymerase [Setosphaeria turcica ambiguivirus 1]